MLKKTVPVVLMLLTTAPFAASGQEAQIALPPMPPVALSMNNLVRLLSRPEVQSHLRLTLKQKNALADLFNNPQRGRANIQITTQGQPDPAAIRQQIQDQIAARQGEQEKQIAEILKPEQMTRLHELDMQWQGPVALGDSKVAGEVKLSADHQKEIAGIVQDYQIKRQQALMELAQEQTESAPNGRRAMRRIMLNTNVLDNPLHPTRKKLDALRKEAEGKIIGLLSAEEKERWTKAQGEPFTFRKDQPGSWR
jgi:hypothetical protein